MLLSLHGSTGPYKQRDVFPIRQIKRHYQVLQQISQRHQRESHKEQEQRCNGDQLNLPLKKKKKNTQGGKWLPEQEAHIFVPRDVHGKQVLILLLKGHLVHAQAKKIHLIV